MKKRVIYLQEDNYSCGACCVQSIVSHYGGYVPLEAVLEDTSTTQQGTNAYELVKAFKKYGFSSYGKKIDLSDLKKEDLPLIAHVIKNGLEHFVVVYEIEENAVVTMDPEKGEVKYSKEKFCEMSDGKFIFAFIEGEIPKYSQSKTLFNILLQNFNKNKKALVVITTLCVVGLILNLIASFHFKFLENTLTPLKITILCILVKVIFLIISVLKDYITIRLSAKIDRHLNSDFLKHIFYLPRRFLLRKKSGELIKRINDVSFIRDLVIRISVVNTIDLAMLIVSLLLLIKISSKLAIIYLVISLLVSMITFVLNKRVYKKNKANLAIYDEYMGNLIETLGGLESIKNLNSEEYALKKIYTVYDEYVKDKKNMDLYLSFIENTKSFILNSGLLLVNLVGFMSLNQDFTMYDLITMQSIFSLFIASIESILNSHYHLSTGKALYKRCSELLDIETEKAGSEKLSLPFKSLRVEDLSYSYDGIHSNIEEFNVEIKSGDKLLLRGPSGVGKSTLVKCICGMLENYTGTISINGINIKSLSKKTLRERIVYVSQEEKLFSGSIKENVTLGIYKDDLFKKVCNICCLDEVLLSRIDAENTYLVEGGSNLSGGERARIILARALYKNPSIIIIDETLSSISEEMEDKIIRNLLNIKKLTVIYITHRRKEHLFKKFINLKKEG